MPTIRHKDPASQRDRVLALASQRGVLRPRDLREEGLSREVLRRLQAEGFLERRARGLYVPTSVERSENEMLALASRRVPHGVICLLSALRFHDLTTQNPSRIWMAIDRKARVPKAPELPLQIVRFSGRALSEGVEEHPVDGVVVRVYSAAKTVADCFKYRRKIGLDVALEALREYLHARLGSVDELWRYAAICRVQNVIRPYLEAMVESGT
jgi:predicted transcriptional regulator of viral defense system